MSLSSISTEKKRRAYFEFWADVRDEAHVDSPVLDTEQFVHHRLIRPLREQRRHRVVPPVQNEE